MHGAYLAAHLLVASVLGFQDDGVVKFRGAGQEAPTLPMNVTVPPGADGSVKVAHIRLSGALEEAVAAQGNPLFVMPENFVDLLQRVEKASKDSLVGVLYLEIDGLGIGLGKVNEFRQSIAKARGAGKKVIAFLPGEGGSGLADYLVACACDEVTLPALGGVPITGISLEVEFYKDLFEKLGVQADMLAVGSFKSAGEPYMRNGLSPENRQQLESLADDYYNYLVQCISESRQAKGLTPEKVKAAIDEGPLTPQRALELGLIDRIGYSSEVQAALKQNLQANSLHFEKDYARKEAQPIDVSNPLGLLRLLAPPTDGILTSNPHIAVIYASGDIVTGPGGQGLFGGNAIGSSTFVDAIRRAAEEPQVRAIVLRVDSGGGSALASDLIYNALVDCGKPVVASMSDVAASGGYYISAAASKIFAEPQTVTGSIGVVGGKIVYGGVYEKVGIKVETIRRGANAGSQSSTEPFSEGQRKAYMASMQQVYDVFLDKVLEGRARAGNPMTRERLLELAGGRVWTGRQAKENGLIDELGTLDDAIVAAKVLAGLAPTDEVDFFVLPKARNFLESLIDVETGARTSLPPELAVRIQQLLPELGRGARAFETLLNLRHEKVWAMMPFEIQVK